MFSDQWLHSWVWSSYTVGCSIFSAYFQQIDLLKAIIRSARLPFLTPADLPHHKHTVLRMDEAFLTVHNELDTEVVVSWMSEHCYQVGSRPPNSLLPVESVCFFSDDVLMWILVC